MRHNTASASAAVATLLLVAACGGTSSDDGAQETNTGDGGSGSTLTDPVEFVIPFGVGGGMDLAGRTVAELLEKNEIVDVPIQVTNLPGGGGSVGLAHMSTNLPGQPNALGIIATHIISTPLLQQTDVTYEGVTPLARLFTEYAYVLVRPDSEFESIQDVAEKLEADPASVTIGAASTGAAGHLTISKFALDIGVDPTELVYVAHDGNEVIPAVLGEHVDVALAGPDVLDLVEAGELEAIAVSAPEPLPGPSEGIPTFIDEGYNVEHSNWRLLYGPPDMPADAVSHWKDALTAMNETDDWKEAMETNGWSEDFTTEGLEGFLAEEHKEYDELLNTLGLTTSSQ